MGHIRRREGPRGVRWQARYKGPDGTVHVKTFDRQKAAQRWLSTNDIAMSDGKWVNPNAGKVTYRDWAVRWYASVANLRDTTKARDLSILRTHLLPEFGDKTLTDIDHMTVRQWVGRLTGKRRPATVHKAFQVFDKTMQAAVDARVLTHNPCERVPLPKVEDEELRVITPTELHRLADCLGRYKALGLLAGYGGLRIGELAALQPSRVDLLRGTVQVVETAVEVSGRIQYHPPKTKAGRRTVPIPRVVVEALTDHITRQPGDRVFNGPHGGPLRPAGWRQRVWTPAVEAAGLAPLTPHQLRHTAISLWISSGVDPKRIAKWAGHASVRTVLDRYGHLYDSDDQAFIDRLSVLAEEAERQQSERGLVLRLSSADNGPTSGGA